MDQIIKGQMKFKDIAVAAKVSPATVSLVYKGKPGVGLEKRREITALLVKNGYNVAAVAFPTQKNILFLKFIRHSLLVDGNPGFVTSIMDSVEQECRQKGYNLLVSTITPSTTSESLGQFSKDAPDGILLLGTEMTEDDFLLFQDVKCPLIIVDNPVESYPLGSITMDNRSAIYESVRYLRSLGHPRIGFLKNELPSSNCRCRERAFKDAIADAGLAPEDGPMYAVRPTTLGAYHSIKNCLEKNVTFPSAVIANNDSIALGAAKAFREFGIRIPDDLSLVGFDGIQFSEIADPPLTTTAVPCKEIGTLAVQMLCQYIGNPSITPYKIRVTTKMVIRSSAAPYAD